MLKDRLQKVSFFFLIAVCCIGVLRAQGYQSPETGLTQSLREHQQKMDPMRPPLIEEMRMTYEEAEAAVARQDYETAREAYLELLRLGAKEVANQETYVDLILRIATVEAQLKNFESAEQRLRELLKESPNEDLLVGIESLRAQLHKKQGHPGQAYRILKNLELTVPSIKWPSDVKSFLVGVEYSLNRHYGEVLRNAERLVDSGLYEESVSLFQEVLASIENKTYPAALDAIRLGEDSTTKIYYRLAEAYFYQGSYTDASIILEKITARGLSDQVRVRMTDIERNAYYLLGQVYREMGKPEHAMKQFLTYLDLDDKEGLQFYDDAHFQLGLIHFQKQAYRDAEQYFKVLMGNASNIKLYYLGRIYQARIHLHRQEYEAVEQTLFPLLGIFTTEESLRYEAAYLRGEAFYQRQLYDKAANLFEEALPSRNRNLAEWYAPTLYNLAWCYLKLGEALEGDKLRQASYLEKGIKVFNELIDYNQDDRAYLGLARLYMLQGQSSGNEESSKEAENLLERKGSFSSVDLDAEALLLRGELAKTYTKREEIFDTLTKDIYKRTPAFALAWYFKGLNALKQGQKLNEQSDDPFEVNALFDRSVAAFLKAFSLLQEVDKRRAALSLRNAAQAEFYKNSKESRLEAYALFSQLINENHEIFSTLENQDEVLYLQGVVASRLLFEDKREDFIDATHRILMRVFEQYPKGEFVDHSLNLLGTIYFRQGNYERAEEVFARLAAAYPQSEYAGEAWFWAGESAEWQRKDPDLVKEYRQKVFDQYPETKYGPEAYFKYYKMKEYMQGNAQALAHLQNMELLYQHSPYLILVHYLVGMNHKQDRMTPEGTLWKKADLAAAIHSFEEGQKVFDKCYARGTIPNGDMEYFITVRYRSLLERALIKLKMAQQVEGAKQQVYLEWAAEAFEDILRDFHDRDHPLARVLTRGHPYPRIFEESEYGLVQVYIAAHEDAGAEELLSTMLEKYAKSNIKKGYYLARAWYEQGRLAMRRGENELALKFLTRASESSDEGSLLNTEQRLDLWIQQSNCYRELKHFDTAMLMLSHVINEDVVSPQRLRAMYLRAEVYELEGRHDLAVRQLEATAKKGGEWANKAKDKLERDYGFN